MAENVPLATRAPENDAMETTTADSKDTASPIPGDTAAQSGASMGEHCTSDRPTPVASNPPAGEFTTLNNISCYVSKPSSYPHSPGKLLLLLTGGTGITSTNNQLQADAYAERGFVVVMPDQFGGDSAPNVGVLSDREAQEKAETEASSIDSSSLLERIKVGVAETAKSFLIDMWLARHTPEKVLPIVRSALEAAKESYADSVANGGGVYGVGYCFGAKYILILCGANSQSTNQPESSKTATAVEGSTDTDQAEAEKSATAPQPELKAGSIAHGTLVTKEDIEAVQSPIYMACIEGDSLFPDDVREQGRAHLELNAIDHDIRLFHDVPHGFAVLGDYPESRIRERQTEAFDMMAAWLESH